GPNAGSGGTGYYVYLETSNNRGAYVAGETAQIQSNELLAENVSLSFDYHFYGANIGRLSVDVNDNGSWVNDVWFIEGQQHSSNSAVYSTASVSLAGYSGQLLIRIRATAVGGYKGDMALDNIVINGDPVVLANRPPVFAANPLLMADANEGGAYQESLANLASDPDANDQLTFTKVSGPSWLSVAANGGLTGTPTSGDVGANSLMVRVTDLEGLSADTQVNLNVWAIGQGELQVLSFVDFENGFNNGWFNASGDSDNWSVRSGKTPSSSTGPDAGGPSTPGQYAYLETSSSQAYNAGDSAFLQSPVLTGSSRTLSYAYHMYGSNMGTLSVDVYHNGSWVLDVATHQGQSQSSYGADYSLGTVDLSAYSGDISVRFRGVADGGYRGDMAIDDIEIKGRN
ncbi:MAG: hypothetical protein HRT35_34715, partial [Algicola sp.]|nr:hypothetical protein [Algicola sp.]